MEWNPDWLPEFARAPWAIAAGRLLLLVFVALVIHLVLRRWLLKGIRRIVVRTRMDWDEVLVDAGVLRRALIIFPLLIFRLGLTAIPGLSPLLTESLHRVIEAGMMLVAALTIDALLTAMHKLYLRTELSATRPIKSYVQLAKLVVYAIITVFIIARLADQSPWIFVSGLGAAMAIILLIFRDTILSLVASVQLTNNDLIRVGDWIEMPQFNADGDVIDIALNTVSVKNWDKTITVIPTHKFLDNSFRNWRSMFEGGGRRIKRAIHINTSTTRFLTDAEIEQFSRWELLREYMDTKRGELEEFNERRSPDPDTIINARRLTNIGTFRAYILAYLRNHPKVHQGMTLIVRQLAPTPEGVPLEVYAFTNDTGWVAYEGIQGDIFDHILAIVPEFGLSVYQRPSGHDLSAANLQHIAEAG